MILWDEKNPFENPFECDGEEAYESCLLLDQDEKRWQGHWYFVKDL